MVTSFGPPPRRSSWQLVRHSFNHCHPIFYCFKRKDGFLQNRIYLGFDIDWTNTFQMILYHITVINFSLLMAVKQILNHGVSWHFKLKCYKVATIVFFLKQQPLCIRQIGYFRDYPRSIDRSGILSTNVRL